MGQLRVIAGYFLCKKMRIRLLYTLRCVTMAWSSFSKKKKKLNEKNHVIEWNFHYLIPQKILINYADERLLITFQIFNFIIVHA